MSYTDNSNSTATMEPHATISAQALIQSQPERCGFLRKRGQKERMLENLHLSKHINWRQRFVVVKQGCCYCFADEVSRAPLRTFSLQGYNRVFRTTADRAVFVFAVEPAASWRQKLHVFAAASDDDRRIWMEAFRAAMVEANSAQSASGGSGSSGDGDVFKDLEKPVFESEEIEPPSKNVNKFRSGEDNDYDNDEEVSSDDSDYDRPDEEWHKQPKELSPPSRRELPLPPVPDGTKDQTKDKSKDHTSPPVASRPFAPPRTPKNLPPDPSKRHKVPLPLVLPKPAVKPKRRVSERDCLFDDNNREAAIEILREKKALGTFLIRKSRQGDSKVLAVMTSEDVKEYKIFIVDGQVTLDKKTLFDTVDDLLEHYTKSPLPNRQQTLGRSFSSDLP